MEWGKFDWAKPILKILLVSWSHIMSTESTVKEPYHATLKVEGVIVSRKDLNEMLETFLKNKAYKNVFLSNMILASNKVISML